MLISQIAIAAYSLILYDCIDQTVNTIIDGALFFNNTSYNLTEIYTSLNNLGLNWMLDKWNITLFYSFLYNTSDNITAIIFIDTIYFEIEMTSYNKTISNKFGTIYSSNNLITNNSFTILINNSIDNWLSNILIINDTTFLYSINSLTNNSKSISNFIDYNYNYNNNNGIRRRLGETCTVHLKDLGRDEFVLEPRIDPICYMWENNGLNALIQYCTGSLSREHAQHCVDHFLQMQQVCSRWSSTS